MVLGTSRRIAIFKIATLQRQSHLQSCNVPFRQVTMQSFGGVQGGLFKGMPCWGAARRLPGQSPSTEAVFDILPLCNPPRRAQTASFDGRRLSKVLLRYS